jgi:hypothetical protein
MDKVLSIIFGILCIYCSVSCSGGTEITADYGRLTLINKTKLLPENANIALYIKGVKSGHGNLKLFNYKHIIWI